ncbi:MAG: hypothetical protein HUK23_02485 [Sphaerochaetaceae bacterium]|nr:hypothetical protein [Sphaerochaetaceae bacterium]
MKKILIALMALAMIFVIASCSKSSATTTTAATTTTQTTTTATTTAAATPSTGTVDTEYDPNKTVDFVQQTNENNRVVTVGTIDKSLYKTPVFVTSFGQSTDAAMLETVMKKLGVEYVYNPTAQASALANYKTVVIAVGASTKGLGAAGISESEERARATQIMDFIKANNIEVICCHIGGSARRGTLSDVFADMVMAESSLIVLKEDANFDYKFTKYAEEKNIPISLVYATKDTLTVFTDVFN